MALQPEHRGTLHGKAVHALTSVLDASCSSKWHVLEADTELPYMSTTTFYETVSHERLESSALQQGFPMTLLNVAFQIYRGCRILSAENRISPGAFAGKGILAGCSIAPALSKLALFDCCRRAHDSQCTDTINVWLDDISGDAECKLLQETARRIYRFYTLLKEELGAAQLLMSREKSAFVCSDGKTTKALKALLKPDDPKICSVVKDLGVDSSGGARRRVAQQTQRLQKAGKRNKRLQRLKVKRKAVTTRICNVSILTAGTWGHQAQGLAPSKIRVLRGIASGPVRIGLGSSEVVFDMQDSGVKDPFSKVVQEHWSTFAKCMMVRHGSTPGSTYLEWPEARQEIDLARCEGEHANTLRHAILDCPAWASFDLGPDKTKQEDCLS